MREGVNVEEGKEGTKTGNIINEMVESKMVWEIMYGLISFIISR